MKTWEIEKKVYCKGIPARSRKLKDCDFVLSNEDTQSDIAPNAMDIAKQSETEFLKFKKETEKTLKQAQDFSFAVYVFEIKDNGGGFISRTIPLFDDARSFRFKL